MTPAGEELQRAVDEVLEPAWPTERRRAAWRVVRSSAWRWAGGMAAVALLDLVLFVATGAALPMTFFAVIGLVAAIATMPDAEERAHLSRRPPPGRRPYVLPRP